MEKEIFRLRFPPPVQRQFPAVRIGRLKTRTQPADFHDTVPTEQQTQPHPGDFPAGIVQLRTKKVIMPEKRKGMLRRLQTFFHFFPEMPGKVVIGPDPVKDCCRHFEQTGQIQGFRLFAANRHNRCRIFPYTRLRFAHALPLIQHGDPPVNATCCLRHRNRSGNNCRLTRCKCQIQNTFRRNTTIGNQTPAHLPFAQIGEVIFVPDQQIPVFRQRQIKGFLQCPQLIVSRVRNPVRRNKPVAAEVPIVRDVAEIAAVSRRPVTVLIQCMIAPFPYKAADETFVGFHHFPPVGNISATAGHHMRVLVGNKGFL